ncbi:MAG: hypothetical protein WAM64_02810 [Acidimicrobiales bacterium]
MRHSLELGVVVIVVLLAVIVSLAVQRNSGSSQASVLSGVPQICDAGSGSPQCWTISATPRGGASQDAVTSFLTSVLNKNGAGTSSVLGTFELQRCSNPRIVSDNVDCTLWSTGTKSDAKALETLFVGSHLFRGVVAARF